MFRCFRGDKIIKVHVSNGSKTHIWCRVAGDKMLKVQGETGGGFGVQGIQVTGHTTGQYKYLHGATRGFSQIQIGNTLEFELSTSSNSVYMTVFKERKPPQHHICKNHEITRNRNYIINRDGALLDAKKNKQWIDTTGRYHIVTKDDKYRRN